VSSSGHSQDVQSAEAAVPWYHYIPLKPDYSDLYDIMAFFAGPIDEVGNINESLGHDVSPHPPWVKCQGQTLTSQHLAQKIGEAGQRFALDHWNWANMQAYVSQPLDTYRVAATD
jgi:hypothetical protein